MKKAQKQQLYPLMNSFCAQYKEASTLHVNLAFRLMHVHLPFKLGTF